MTILVGRAAPDFTAAAVLSNNTIVDNFNLTDFIANQYGLIFFYPLDFTFVCPTELISLHKRMPAFNARKVAVLGVSVDSQFTHHAWRNTAIAQGGIGQLDFPLVADLSHQICKNYGVECQTPNVAFRAAFIIDKQGVVRSQIVNDLPLGRNIDELLRLIDALQFFEQHGEVCPAGWQPGANAIKPTSQGIANYLENNADQL